MPGRAEGAAWRQTNPRLSCQLDGIIETIVEAVDMKEGVKGGVRRRQGNPAEAGKAPTNQITPPLELGNQSVDVIITIG